MGFSNLTGGSNEASNGAVLAETGSGTLTFLASVDHFVFLGEVVTDPFAVVEAGAQCVHLSIHISHRCQCQIEKKIELGGRVFS